MRVRAIPCACLALTWLAAARPAHAQTPPSAATSNATPEQQAKWQQELVQAKDDRTNGRSILLTGIAVFAAGEILLVRCFNDESNCSGARARTSFGLSLGGLILAGVGDSIHHRGSFSVKWLESHGPAPMANGQWQTELTAAKAKRSSGRKIMWTGIGILTAGFAIESSRECRSGDCGSQAAGGSLLLGGAVVSAIGSSRATDGGLAIKLLRAHPSVTAPPGVLSRHVEQTLTIAPGTVTKLAYTVRW